MIRAMFWLVGLLLIATANPASAFIRGGTATISAVCPANDGTSGAPTGTIQYPSLLSVYVKTIHELGCNVVGVDYYAGVPAAQSLTDWETIGNGCITVVLPGGGGHAFGQVTVSCNSTTINGVDFSLHGGAILTFSGVTGSVLTNSKFGGANLTTVGTYVIESTGSGGLTVQFNTIDGGGAGSANALIGIVGGGPAIVQYNYMTDCPSQFLDYGSGSTGGSLTFKYNLMENCGMQPLAHLNWQQLGGGSYTIVTEFNTTKQSPQSGGPGEGYQWYNNAGGANVLTLTSAVMAYNTMIATGSNSMSYMVHGNNVGDTVTSAVAHDNYADPTGTAAGNATGVFYPGTFSQWTLSTNWNMVNGAAVSNSP